jgi:hypothetical protein
MDFYQIRKETTICCMQTQNTQAYMHPGKESIQPRHIFKHPQQLTGKIFSHPIQPIPKTRLEDFGPLGKFISTPAPSLTVNSLVAPKINKTNWGVLDQLGEKESAVTCI